MFLSSIDISFFALPLVFQGMGLFFGFGFFFYLLVLSLMASQCYIELKRFSTIAKGSDREYVGLIDLIEECCGSASNGIHNDLLLIFSEVYLKFVTVSTLVMLLASNQAFITIVLYQLISHSVVGTGAALALENTFGKVQLLLPIFAFVWVFVPLFKNTKASSFTLMTKMIMFTMLTSCSFVFCFLTSKSLTIPSFFPDNISNID